MKKVHERPHIIHVELEMVETAQLAYHAKFHEKYVHGFAKYVKVFCRKRF